ncbi:hypothetical protein A2382_05005 [Candidatus Woesebacteria bacterium RIFOXYB1_FULL_38_16]|uniref:Uncharacterized protein n=1 Tax=Candidatus Woesebacteria bacterium RIFOXYB1_FULL_38_16 TaxID=1802538 RepID=A0A1F8CVB8_9BACT|nr:MAG: hypothetical protein A2191_00155 [Candidatus Woesebacteria bacterium RIFOXYA1_FULL_38_9]OGM80016.1 MAG: hypothetical protein A2382_05005 [Candidatus Woesebacteria bacterium RIFOXYB1_FULL_38_16]
MKISISIHQPIHMWIIRCDEATCEEVQRFNDAMQDLELRRRFLGHYSENPSPVYKKAGDNITWSIWEYIWVKPNDWAIFDHAVKIAERCGVELQI